MKNQIQKRIFLTKLNLDFLPIKKDNNLWVCQVWKNDKYLKTGKKEYKTPQQALIETESIFYEKYSKDLLKN